MAVDIRDTTADDADGRTAPVSSNDDSAIPFLQDSFDPADYLNASLPALAVTTSDRAQGDRASVVEVSTKTQVLLTQLNAQTSRVTNTLSQLTDEIIRSGSRLAYEVEILRGETTGLSEVLNGKLKDDIGLFSRPQSDLTPSDKASLSITGEPDHIRELRMLTHVRSRLDLVIKVFGEAMEWPVAPSEMSSSLISVTAPNITPEEISKREAKGKEAAQALRNGVVSLLETGETPEAGIAAATARISDLRMLALVWKGTAEEKYRARFIDGLAKLVEEEASKLAKKSEGRRMVSTPSLVVDRKGGDGTRVTSEGSYGFMNSLRKIRGEIYME